MRKIAYRRCKVCRCELPRFRGTYCEPCALRALVGWRSTAVLVKQEGC